MGQMALQFLLVSNLWDMQMVLFDFFGSCMEAAVSPEGTCWGPESHFVLC